MSVVYYGNYLTYFEVARVEYLRERGLPMSEVNRRVHMPVVEACVHYARPALPRRSPRRHLARERAPARQLHVQVRDPQRRARAGRPRPHAPRLLGPASRQKMIALPDWLKEIMPDGDLDLPAVRT